MKEIYKRYQVIFILSAVVIVMAIIKVKYGVVTYDYSDKKILPAQQTIEKVVPTKTTDPDYPLLDILPYSGRGFTVDRYIAPLTLVVKIKGLDENLVAQELEEWFKEQGIATESHKLKFEKFENNQ